MTRPEPDYYASPALYDATFEGRQFDVDYYLRLASALDAAHASGSSPSGVGPMDPTNVEEAGERRIAILELGAGSGRVTAPLAEAGYEVVAVEPHAGMRQALLQRLAKLPSRAQARVTLEPVDARELNLERRFELVLATFNVVGHLDDGESLLEFLRKARAHLKPGGELVFDTLAPDDEELLAAEGDEFELDDMMHPETGERYAAAERFHYDFETRILTATTTYQSRTTNHTFSVPLRVRQWFPQELKRLVLDAGFSQVVLSADYTNEPELEGANMLVVRAR